MISVKVLYVFCVFQSVVGLSSTVNGSNTTAHNLVEGFSPIQGRESEQARQQGLFPKLFVYLRNALVSPTSTATTTAATEKSVDDDVLAYEDSKELHDEGFRVGLEDDAEDSIYTTEKGRYFDGTAGNDTTERRGLPIYLFQGQYLAEPRLNRFVDGAMDNLGQEMKSATLDPLYFLVLPKGRVVGRPKPIKLFPGKPLRRRKPMRQRTQNFRPLYTGRSLTFATRRTLESGRQLQRLASTGQRARNRVVGAGRVEGLSKVLRDGDAEMQLFGNYTLIRAHYNMGPLYLVMQFRTVRGIRRADAILEKVKIHTVTRVNTQGCEMIDFLLDRPHAETIEIRGQLFPMATQVAKNVFSRLFADDSFLVARIREKTGLALLSKKTSF